MDHALMATSRSVNPCVRARTRTPTHTQKEKNDKYEEEGIASWFRSPDSETIRHVLMEVDRNSEEAAGSVCGD